MDGNPILKIAEPVLNEVKDLPPHNDKTTENFMQNQNNANPPSKNSMTIWLVILVIVIIVVLGIAGCYLYKIGTQEETPQTQSSAINTEGLDNLNVKTKTATPTTTQSTDNKVSQGSTYYNSRFGFKVTEPDGFEKFESQNGDGASFSKNSPPVAIGVYGAHNTENLTATQYLDKEFSTLQMETPDAKEIGWNEVEMDGCEGERRAWQYSPVTGGGQDIEESAVCMKDGIVYGMYLTLSANDYDDYSSVFNNILFSFKFGN